MSKLDKAPELRSFPLWVAVLALAAVTLLMFGDLFFGGPVILSAEGTDLFLQDIHWRTFGFGHLRQGEVALWNPHIFCGTPYFGAFQSALFYPLNLHYLLLALPAAINFGIALHIFLAGVFTFLWARRRGLHPLACFLAGVLFMFCGPHFLHVYAGHLGRLSAMVWTPLIFLAVDGWFDRRTLGWALLGALAVGMQIMAGDPQYVFYTGVAALLYAGFCLWGAAKKRSAALGLAAIFVGGALLSAVQVVAGLDALRASVRGDAVPYDFASKFAFPPENILTALAPGFFGDLTNLDYWGRCYLWEASLFFSVTGLALAVYGALTAKGNLRRFSVAMAAILFILALGAHTPLFRLLYLVVPGFDKFRGISKFSLQMVLFLIMLSAIGLDELIRRGRSYQKLALGVLVAAGVVALGALAVRLSADAAPEGLWQKALQRVPPAVVNGALDPKAEPVYQPRQLYSDAGFARRTGAFASWSLAAAAVTLVVLAGLLFCFAFSKKAAYAVVALATLEMLLFAMISRATFDPQRTRLPEVERLAAEQPGDYRVMNLVSANLAMSLGMYDVRGYAPLLSGRYAEFAAFTQGADPDRATQYLQFTRDSRLLDLLRLRYVIAPTVNGLRLTDRGPVMPRLHLLYQYRVIPERDAAFAAMGEAGFNPREEVVLDRLPVPAPGRADPGATVKSVEETTDSVTIEAHLNQPAILLVTDTYYPGWRVTPVGKGPQSIYPVLAADYAFRAIPLSAGEHRFRLEYAPAAFRIGAWVSALALAAFLGLLGWTAARRR